MMNHQVSKNAAKLYSFVSYCQANPNQRFFQALRNWIALHVNIKWTFVVVRDHLGEEEDTFYWE